MTMYANLKDLGLQALNELYSSLVSAKTFAEAQVPDVCRQVIRWKVAHGAVCCGILLVAFAAVAFVSYMTWGIKSDAGMPIGIVMSSFLWLLWLSSSTMVILCGPPATALKGLVAPKLLLIDIIGEYIRGAKGSGK
jgi:hypothetical protein